MYLVGAQRRQPTTSLLVFGETATISMGLGKVSNGGLCRTWQVPGETQGRLLSIVAAVYLLMRIRVTSGAHYLLMAVRNKTYSRVITWLDICTLVPRLRNSLSEIVVYMGVRTCDEPSSSHLYVRGSCCSFVRSSPHLLQRPIDVSSGIHRHNQVRLSNEFEVHYLAMAEFPDETKELRLVNNVEMKIALADTDAKLQKLLNLYLPPLLLKLGSPHASVRNKVASTYARPFLLAKLTTQGGRSMFTCKHSNKTIEYPPARRPAFGSVQRPGCRRETSASSEFRFDVRDHRHRADASA
jgi:hypothetical protein